MWPGACGEQYWGRSAGWECQEDDRALRTHSQSVTPLTRSLTVSSLTHSLTHSQQSASQSDGQVRSGGHLARRSRTVSQSVSQSFVVSCFLRPPTQLVDATRPSNGDISELSSSWQRTGTKAPTCLLLAPWSVSIRRRKLCPSTELPQSMHWTSVDVHD